MTDVRATLANGTTTTAIRGTGGQEVHVVEGAAADGHRIELRLEPAPDAPYDYALVSTVESDGG